MRLEVTQNDIDDSRPDDCGACPIAVALRRHFPRSTDAEVCEPADDDVVAVVYVNKRSAQFTLGRNAAKFVNDFDEGLPVKPTSFYLKAWAHKTFDLFS